LALRGLGRIAFESGSFCVSFCFKEVSVNKVFSGFFHRVGRALIGFLFKLENRFARPDFVVEGTLIRLHPDLDVGKG